MNLNFCFLFHVYANEEIVSAKTLVQDLRKFYPDSQIICIFDGYKNFEVKQYLELNSVTVVEGKNLKPQKNGAAYIIRFLEKFLELSNSEILIKVDPDTLVLRQFKEFPDLDVDIAGTLLQNEGIQFVSGGCIWIKKKTVSTILNSRILLDSRYKLLPIFSYKIPTSDELSLAEDRVLSQVASVLNLKQDNWIEVLCNVLPIEKVSDEWAIFHPLKYTIDTLPVEPVQKIPSLSVAKVKIQSQIIELAAQKQKNLIAGYSQEEQKLWAGKEVEARAILEQGISAANYLRTEAISTSGATTEAEIEVAILKLAQTIIQRAEQWRHASHAISGIRAYKWKEVEAMVDIEQVLSYKPQEGW